MDVELGETGAIAPTCRISLIIANINEHRLAHQGTTSPHHLSHRPRTGRATPPSHTAIMKPVVSAMQAWQCTVISVFAIIILGVLSILFNKNHPELVGGTDDPENGPAVASTLFVAVLVYIGFFVFCGLQGLLHIRENRRGAIALQ
ncbi:uncharacterized protein CTRU02_205946 [Colletotrichum truncatum]|uniref:Uncharacterized protein n=1 Tax=Colletotrichum truncatum TaxID=5467 RepID=A0ACC3Z5G0_COLTU